VSRKEDIKEQTDKTKEREGLKNLFLREERKGLLVVDFK